MSSSSRKRLETPSNKHNRRPSYDAELARAEEAVKIASAALDAAKVKLAQLKSLPPPPSSSTTRSSTSSKSGRRSSGARTKRTAGGMTAKKKKSAVPQYPLPPPSVIVSNSDSIALAEAYEPLKKQLDFLRASATHRGEWISLEGGIIHKSVPGMLSNITRVPSMAAIDTSELTVHIVFLTTAPLETFALLRALGGSIKQINDDPWVYYLADLPPPSKLKCVVVKSTQGSDGPQASGPTVAAAIRTWGPRLVLSVGFCYGTRPKDQEYGDILVASSVFPFNLTRDEDGLTVFTSTSRRIDRTVLNALAQGEAAAPTPSNAKRPSAVKIGLMASGNVLLDNAKRVSDTVAGIEATLHGQDVKDITVIGGEMEAAGMIDACLGANVSFGMVKAICDFGGLDGRKTKDSQPYAAHAAVRVTLDAIQRSAGAWVTSLPVPIGRGIVTMDFSAFLADKTATFVGRNALTTSVDGWRVKKNGSPVLLVVGEPGIGKSAWAAAIVSGVPGLGVLSDFVAAYHFCRYDAPATLDPRKWIGNMAKRLLVTCARRNISVPHNAIVNLTQAIADSQTRIVDAWTGFLSALPRTVPRVKVESPLILLVDSLDEALSVGGVGGRDIIAALAGSVAVLPSWMKLICTTRPEEAILKRLMPSVKAEVISAAGEENLADARDYIVDRLGANVKEEVIQKVIRASGGNFLYLAQVLDQKVVGDVVEAVESGALPDGLARVYSITASRLYPTRDAFADVLPLLSVLTAAAGPITIEFAGNAASVSLGAVREAVRGLSSVLAQEPDGIRVYHKSFKDWLTHEGWHDSDLATGAGLRVDLPSGHAGLAEAGMGRWKTYDYALQYTPYHAANSNNELVQSRVRAELLMRWEFLSLKAEKHGVGSVLDDLEEDSIDNSDVGAVHAAMLAHRFDDGGMAVMADAVLRALVPRTAASRDAAALFAELSTTTPFTPGFDAGMFGEGTVGLQAVLRDSTRVNSVVGARDGYVVSGGNDKNVRVWDVAGGKVEATLEGHTHFVTGLAYVETLGQIVSVGLDAELRVWSNVAWTAVGPPHKAPNDDGNSKPLVCIAALHDGVVTGDNAGNLRVWRAPGWNAGPPVVAAHHGSVGGVDAAFNLIASGGDKDGMVRVWKVDAKSGLLNPVGGKTDSGESILDVALICDGAGVVAAQREGLVTVVALSSGATVAKLSGHEDDVTGVGRVNADATRIVTSSKDKTLRIWSVDATRPRGNTALAKLDGHEWFVTSVSTSSIGAGLVVSGSADSTVRVWNTDKAVAARTGLSSTVVTPKRDMTCLSLSADGNGFVAGAYDGTLWSLTPGDGSMSAFTSISGHGGKEVYYIARAAARRGLLTAGAGGVNQWSDHGTEIIASYRRPGAKGAVKVVHVVGDEGFVTGDNDGVVCLWSFADSGKHTKPVAHWRASPGVINTVLVVPGSEKNSLDVITGGSGEFDIKIWRKGGNPLHRSFLANLVHIGEETPEVVVRCSGHTSQVWNIVSLDEDSFASAAWDGAIFGWSVKTGEKLWSIAHAHGGSIVSSLVNLGSGLIASGGGSSTGGNAVSIWDVKTQERVGNMVLDRPVDGLAWVEGKRMLGMTAGRFIWWYRVAPL